MLKIISEEAIKRRFYWIEEIKKISGNFSNDSKKIEAELSQERKDIGDSIILDHLRLCGDIPESYPHDSSEEKLYSKYTDALINESYKTLGYKSLVLTERADSADVEVFADDYSFIADAKAFRLSRTAKNQKDFKVQAMDNWKRGKPYAMVVCPIYQLPTRSSQIYMQASSRNVCIFTYSHLAVLVSFSFLEGKEKSRELLYEIFKSISTLNPSKSAGDYWKTVNKTMLSFSSKINKLWSDEKKATLESIAIAKDQALKHLAQEREKIMRMNHQEALLELIKVHKIHSKIEVIKTLSNNDILGIS